jgi:hypothetical protein
MRNFDFSNLRSTICSARRASAIWVTELVFQALAWNNFRCSSSARQNSVAYFFPLNFQLFNQMVL